MKYPLIFVHLLITGSLLGQAKLSVDNDVRKFDKTPEGEVLKADFILENKGDQPLIISSYKVECKCTKAEYPKEPIAPGAADTLHVTFDTNQKMGWQYRKVRLFSNDPDSPHEVELRVKVISKE